MNSKYADAMFEGVEWKHYPIYIVLIFIIGFQGMMFIYMASEHGYDPANVQPIADVLSILMYFLAVLPLFGGVANVIAVWYWGESDV